MALDHGTRGRFAEAKARGVVGGAAESARDGALHPDDCVCVAAPEVGRVAQPTDEEELFWQGPWRLEEGGKVPKEAEIGWFRQAGALKGGGEGRA